MNRSRNSCSYIRNKISILAEKTYNKDMTKNHCTIVELFAGVGGFRVGFDRVNDNHKNESPFFSTIWRNQFEPATKTQHASQTYVARFGTLPFFIYSYT